MNNKRINEIQKELSELARELVYMYRWYELYESFIEEVEEEISKLKIELKTLLSEKEM